MNELIIIELKHKPLAFRSKASAKMDKCSNARIIASHIKKYGNKKLNYVMVDFLICKHN